MVVTAEELLGPQPQPVSTAGTGPEMFKPQSNLKLSFLDKQASHLEVHKCAQWAETPPQGIWPYLRPLIHITWSNALELGGVKEK